MAVDEKDCSCEVPLDMNDEDLERYCRQPAPDRTLPTSSRLTGFIALVRLCEIAGRIQQLSSPGRLPQLSSLSTKKSRQYLRRASELDRELCEWLATIPDCIRFSANAPDGCPGGDTELVMCVIIFVIHAGSLLNLNRCVIVPFDFFLSLSLLISDEGG